MERCGWLHPFQRGLGGFSWRLGAHLQIFSGFSPQFLKLRTPEKCFDHGTWIDMNGIDMQRSQDRFCNMLTCDLGAFQLRDLSKAMENPPSMELLMGTSNRYGTLWDFRIFSCYVWKPVRVSHKKIFPIDIPWTSHFSIHQAIITWLSRRTLWQDLIRGSHGEICEFCWHLISVWIGRWCSRVRVRVFLFARGWHWFQKEPYWSWDVYSFPKEKLMFLVSRIMGLPNWLVVWNIFYFSIYWE